MKKRIQRAFAILIVATTIGLPACDIFQDCGLCELVTDDGTNITYGEPIPFCADSYYDKLYSDPVTIAGVTTSWNCY